MAGKRTGRPPMLDTIVTTRRVDGAEVGVTAADAIVERLRAGGYREEAAKSVGLSRQTVYNWTYQGALARRLRLAGHKLTKPQQRYSDFLDAVEQAEAQALLTDWTRLGTLAAGGLPVETIREKVERVPDPANPGQMIEVVTERTITRSATLPSERALMWRLERRWPQHFSPRVELTGKDGSPIELDVDDARGRAKALLDEIGAYRQGIEDGTVVPAPNGNGSTPS